MVNRKCVCQTKSRILTSARRRSKEAENKPVREVECTQKLSARTVMSCPRRLGRNTHGKKGPLDLAFKILVPCEQKQDFKRRRRKAGCLRN